MVRSAQIGDGIAVQHTEASALRRVFITLDFKLMFCTFCIYRKRLSVRFVRHDVI